MRTHIRQQQTSALWIAALGIALVAFSATAQIGRFAHHIITFEAPGAGTGPNQGTQAFGINEAGAISGFYWDSIGLAHGYVRYPDWRMVTFDVPGAGTIPGYAFVVSPVGVLGGQGTYPAAINLEGAVTGWYVDSGNMNHGFLRAPRGAVMTIDIPGAGTGFNQGTCALNINSAGAVAGEFWDSGNVAHGFLRTPDGKITTFDAPGAGKGPGQGTYVGVATSINPAEAIAGYYVDGKGAYHGYVRQANGKMDIFEAPGAGTGAGQGTTAWTINPAGAVTAFYTDAKNATHSYMRDGNSRITTFDVPGASSTLGEGINAEGVITGNYYDSSGVTHGFLRAPDGRVTTFDVPDASTASGQGTYPLSNNAAGIVTGAYWDSDRVLHGFVLCYPPGREKR